MKNNNDNRPMHEVVAEIAELTRAIHNDLHGHGAEVQAAALADLISSWIADCPKHLRKRQWSNFVDLVNDLTPIAESEGHPFDRNRAACLLDYH